MKAAAMQTVVTMRDERPAREDRPSVIPPGPVQAPVEQRVRGPFLPLLLGLAALLTFLLQQLWQLEQEREQLAATLQAANPQLAAAQQLRQSLDRLAADTQRLADGGNAPARVLVDELRRRGITINAAATPAGTAQEAAAATPGGPSGKP